MLGLPTYAQLTADFEADIVEGCPPFIVTFSDSSTGNITQRKWTFGNGNQSLGNNTVVSATYTTPGYYTVKLVVSNGFDSSVVEKQQLIHVLTPPQSNFNQTTPLSGCAPLQVAFTDNSSPGDAPINDWLWDFGDGSSLISQQNPVHVYTVPGTFSVTLQVTDTNGCTNDLTKQSLVSTDPQPTAMFHALGAVSACSPPLQVTFQNSSTGVPPLSYNWDYAIGTSSAQNPSGNYTNPGGYDVSLLVTDGNGCTDTLIKPNYIFIGSIQAEIDVPDTVCLGALVQFADSSDGGNSFSWDFGDGSTSVQQHPTHTYNATGSYTVTLTISAGAGCTSTTTKTIYVEEVIADFTGSPTYGCEVPHVVNYTDQSVGNIVSWEWHFGQLLGPCPGCMPNISTQQNPSATFYESGYFDDTLYVTSAAGCKAMKVIPNHVYIHLVEPEIQMSISEGCKPLKVNFTDASTPQDSIASVLWNFGDANSTTSTLSNPQFTYVDTGRFQVTLSVVTVSGCTLVITDSVFVGLKQVADFNISTITACASDTVYFDNLSSDTNLINKYIWDFGDGEGSGDFEPYHTFEDTGLLDIVLIVAHNGCKDTLEKQNLIDVSGPLVNFTYSINCQNPFNMMFDGEILGATSFTWDFGDGSPLDSTNVNPTHLYPARGAYQVILSAVNDQTNCTYTKEKYVYVTDVQASLTTSDTVFCAPKDVMFNGGGSQDAMFFDWDFGGGTGLGPGTNSMEDAKFDTNNTYVTQLIVADQYGCKDTATVTVRGFVNVANFSANPVFGCVPLGVQFTDQSTSDTTIVGWAYSFGDGTMGYTQNPFHNYAATGSAQYAVTLTISDALGCTSFLTVDPFIETSQPDVNFSASQVFLCVGEPTQFTSILNAAGYTYLWDFGDGTTSTQMNPSHMYQTSGQFDVQLTITNQHGCDSTFTKPNFITVQDIPQPAIIATPSDTSCYPVPVVITDTSSTPNGMFWYWNFGDDTTFITTGGGQAQHIYTLPGNYDVTVIVKTSFGCMDTLTMTDFINITGPIANVMIDPDTACFAADVMFKADSAHGIYKYTWDFGDGIIDSTFHPQDSIEHAYLQTGWITAYLLANDSLGQCPKTFVDSVYVHKVAAQLSVDTNASCLPGVFQFTGTASGANQFNWNFDDGNTGSGIQLSHTYTNSGQFNPSFIVTDTLSNCTDTIDTTIVVHPLPVVSTISDQVICIGNSVQIWASGGDSYIWTPNYKMNDTSIANPIVAPLVDTTYWVEVSDANTCKDTGWVKVKVQQVPSIENFPPDTFVFLGQPFTPEIVSAFDLNYSWNPLQNVECATCPNPDFSPTEKTMYTLTYGDKYGCFSYDTSFTIEVNFEHAIYIPNTFTPNSDNLNDLFKITAYGFKRLKLFQIFNRWGEVVFRTNDMNEGWDGYFKGVLQGPNQLFVYRAVLERYNGEEHEVIGNVLLLSR